MKTSLHYNGRGFKMRCVERLFFQVWETYTRVLVLGITCVFLIRTTRCSLDSLFQPPALFQKILYCQSMAEFSWIKQHKYCRRQGNHFDFLSYCDWFTTWILFPACVLWNKQTMAAAVTAPFLPQGRNTMSLSVNTRSACMNDMFGTRCEHSNETTFYHWFNAI